MTLLSRKKRIQLRDGRRLAWSEWGPENGRPLLFCTGAALSGSLGFGIDRLDSFGLRLIAFDRPGLGGSDPHPQKTLLSFSDDVREVVEQEGLVLPLAVGFSQGAPFALSLAGAGLVNAVALVSGQDELAHPRIRTQLHPDVAGMVAAVESDAEGFARHFASFVSWDGLWQLIMNMSGPRDRALYEEAEFSRLFQQALQEGFAQGPDGYVRDLVNALSRWTVQPEQINVPVDLWYGRLDTSTVHAPDFGDTLASRLPNSTLCIDDEEGGSILWTRSGEILEQLLSRG